MSVSHWQRHACPRVIRCDLAIIGSGIAGICCALHAQRRGLRCVLIDMHRPGFGASTRNAGFLMRGCADNYAVACRTYTREGARALWRLTEDNLRGLLSEGISSLPGVRRVPSVLLASDDDPLEHHELRESASLLRDDGFDATWNEPLDAINDSLSRHARTSGVRGGLFNPHDASCHSGEVLAFLHSRVACETITGQEVFAIELEDSGISLLAPDVRVVAQRAIACTNAWTHRLLPRLGIEPNRGQMFACRPTGVRLEASYYLRRGYVYLRQASDGTVLVGGCRDKFITQEATDSDRVMDNVQHALEEEASRLLAVAREDLNVITRWSGIMGFSPTGLPLVKQIDGLPLWTCAGFTGHGMSMAHAVAGHAVVLALGEPTPDQTLAGLLRG